MHVFLQLMILNEQLNIKTKPLVKRIKSKAFFIY